MRAAILGMMHYLSREREETTRRNTTRFTCIRNLQFLIRVCAPARPEGPAGTAAVSAGPSGTRESDISHSYPFKQNVKVPDDNARKINQAC